VTEIDATIITALIVAIPTVLTSVVVPIVMFILQGRQKRIDLEFQYRREDEVARRASAVAKRADQAVDRAEAAAHQSRVNTEILVKQNEALTTIQETMAVIANNGHGNGNGKK
jgi:hypothetical protein